LHRRNVEPVTVGTRSPDKPPVDWESIEREYRLGHTSMRQLSARFDVQTSVISRRAKKHGWVQDKREAVKALSEAQLLLSNAREATIRATTPTVAEIEQAATSRTKVVLAHRDSAARQRALMEKLLAEVEALTDDPSLFEWLAELRAGDSEASSGVQDRLNEAYQRVIGLPGRVESAKKLAEILERLVKIERQAHGIDEGPLSSATVSINIDTSWPAT
jgi:hypothetical protein